MSSLKMHAVQNEVLNALAQEIIPNLCPYVISPTLTLSYK